MTNNPTDTLISALSAADGTTRRQAALALGAAGDPAAVPALVERLVAEADSCVREDVTWATVQLFEHAKDEVLSLLTSDNPDARRQAAHVLSKIGDPELAEHVLPLVDDEHADVAIKAYRAAANTGNPVVVNALAQRIGDGDSLQRDALTGAFIRLGELGVPALVAALGHAEAPIRSHAAEALGDLGTPAADAGVDALSALLHDSEQSVRIAAVSALGQLGECADAALRSAAEHPDATVAAIATSRLKGRAVEAERASARRARLAQR